jgi:general secretion pathway protein G
MRFFQPFWISTRSPAKASSWSNADDGITVLELMVVLVIMGLVGVVATVQVTQQLDRAKVDVAILQLRQIQGDLELFRIDTGRYPTAEEGLTVLLADTGSTDGWRGPYVRSKQQLVDPWGQVISIRSDSGSTAIVSTGADGKRGGSGTSSDIVFPL